MLTDTGGIVLKQIRTSYNRRMIKLFTRELGKISAGTGIGERPRGKSGLLLDPFTYGRYQIYSNRDSYNINSGEVVKSFFGIAEDVEKYMHGSYALEFTEKALPEGMPAPAVFDLLVEFFTLLENRKKGFGTLVLAYQTKLIYLSGFMPQLRSCVSCGQQKPAHSFHIEGGGIICGDCAARLEKTGADTLIYCGRFDIVDIIEYFAENPLKKLENIALPEETGRLLQKLLREYAACHLGITDMKSETLI